MDGAFPNLKLFVGDPPVAAESVAPTPPYPLPDPHVAATRELIRPSSVRSTRQPCEPFTAAWFEELEQKRYQRHGAWLTRTLEFGRHPGEALLVLGPGMGTDAVRYARTGTCVTVATTPGEFPNAVSENLARAGCSAQLVSLGGPNLPFADASFDVISWNALYDVAGPGAARVNELFRVLKPGGKLIGLFPARYDAAFWQDVLLPLQRLWWKRPPDPATAPKTTARELRQVFGRFAEHRVSKRHLRRGELPHAWRILPLLLLERWIGRVLVLKAKKPIQFARLQFTEATDRAAA